MMAKSAALIGMVMVIMASPASAHGNKHEMGSGQPGEPAQVSRTITVDMYDNYYDPEKLAVEPGETVKFVVENKGQLVHEFNIGTPAMHQAHQKEMMTMMSQGVLEGSQINHHKMKMSGMTHEDPNSVLLEPGQSKTIIWTFNNNRNIEFACNVPGHYQAGMHGDVSFK
ncbi:cupredoxin domain-containing protein [Salinivibrio sp. IB643]|uniref:cupredoxin domain-containing protein n=1 Tax=Salinivibrio sp. IB643 TaxID=1909445 RepID=UPI000989910C|nr:plastocyanin/azurin family copper-binding protein [Salinivibrio sp. IB643]OOE96579.1 copper-binding protein [Salinivibrio sp. IB643]